VNLDEPDPEGASTIFEISKESSLLAPQQDRLEEIDAAVLDTAYLTLQENAAALLRSGEVTLTQICDASGMDQSQVLELLEDPAPVQQRFRRQA